jgi:hypothetical protein
MAAVTPTAGVKTSVKVNRVPAEFRDCAVTNAEENMVANSSVKHLMNGPFGSKMFDVRTNVMANATDGKICET